jgi:hypothetical protein
MAATAKKPRTKKAAIDAVELVPTFEAFKGFDKNLTCRGYQYAVGETFQHTGYVSACSSGFHACEAPLDVLSYYPLTGSRFAKVTLAGKLDRETGGDSKICGGSITIVAELTVPDFIKAAAAWIIAAAKGNVSTGDSSHAASTGYSSHAASTGNYSHAASTGDSSHAASTGYSSHAASTGDSSHAASTGYSSHAASTGNYSHAASTGNYSHAASTGDSSHAASTGDSSHAASTGDSSHAASTGYSSHAASTGNYSHAASTGNYSHAASTGDSSHAASTGDSSHAASTGYRSHAKTLGPNSVAASLWVGGQATAGKGGAIVIGYYDEHQSPPKLLKIGAFMVGEDGIEAGKTYSLSADGKPVEVQS